MEINSIIISSIIILILYFLYILISTRYLIKLYLIIKKTKLSDINSTYKGIVKLEGSIESEESEESIQSHISKTRCIYSKYILKRYDSIKNRNKNKWEDIHINKIFSNFKIKNLNKEIKLDLDKIELDLKVNNEYIIKPRKNIFFNNSLESELIKDLDNKNLVNYNLKNLKEINFIKSEDLKLEEYYIKQNEKLLIFGKIINNNLEKELVLSDEDFLLITNKTEKELLKERLSFIIKSLIRFLILTAIVIFINYLLLNY
jgi:hypothetical protein